jgi:hypothetical protein
MVRIGGAVEVGTLSGQTEAPDWSTATSGGAIALPFRAERNGVGTNPGYASTNRRGREKISRE